MSLDLTANILTIILCIAVIVQAVRMNRQLRAVKDADLRGVVTALDEATVRASQVLADLRRTLGSQAAGLSSDIDQAATLREELSVLIGIANAMAERLVEAGQARDTTASAGGTNREAA